MLSIVTILEIMSLYLVSFGLAAFAIIAIAQILYDKGIITKTSNDQIPNDFTEFTQSTPKVATPKVATPKVATPATFIEFRRLKTPKPYHNKYVSKPERECCEVMKELTGLQFYSTRPDFLKNIITGRNLELDCYNHDLRLAVEYNGIQHYRYPNKFHKSKEQFEKQLIRDDMKRLLCDRNGIYLITVPYTESHRIKEFLTDKYNEFLEVKERNKHNIRSIHGI
jgi:hypothetical protein